MAGMTRSTMTRAQASTRRGPRTDTSFGRDRLFSPRLYRNPISAGAPDYNGSSGRTTVTFFERGVLAIALLSATVVVAAACRRGQSQPPPEYTSTATIKDLM